MVRPARAFTARNAAGNISCQPFVARAKLLADASHVFAAKGWRRSAVDLRPRLLWSPRRPGGGSFKFENLGAWRRGRVRRWKYMQPGRLNSLREAELGNTDFQRAPRFDIGDQSTIHLQQQIVPIEALERAIGDILVFPTGRTQHLVGVA